MSDPFYAPGSMCWSLDDLLCLTGASAKQRNAVCRINSVQRLVITTESNSCECLSREVMTSHTEIRGIHHPYAPAAREVQGFLIG